MSRTRRIERRLDSEHQALKQLLGQNRFLTEQLNTLTNRVVEGEERHKHGKPDYMVAMISWNVSNTARLRSVDYDSDRFERCELTFFSLLNFPKNLEIWKRDSFQIPTLSNA